MILTYRNIHKHFHSIKSKSGGLYYTLEADPDHDPQSHQTPLEAEAMSLQDNTQIEVPDQKT